MNIHDDRDWIAGSDRPGYRWRRKRVAGELMAASLYDLPASERTWPYHYEHGHEEWLLVVSGEPPRRTPEGERVLAPGDAVCFPEGPDGAHQVTWPGRVLIVSNWDVVRRSAVHPDSGMVRLCWGTGDENVLQFRRDDAVDYGEGEDDSG